MTTRLKENNFLQNTPKQTPNIKTAKTKRPNIDHLIQRMLIEKRREQKKNLIIFVFTLLAICGVMMFFSTYI
jgi:hypothetical protein|tara:strand:+ start:437 stop:652 length:216 start_codon:yes stop_codon:yes gene_type:complete